jgi:hypothetical protein
MEKDERKPPKNPIPKRPKRNSKKNVEGIKFPRIQYYYYYPLTEQFLNQ